MTDLAIGKNNVDQLIETVNKMHLSVPVLKVSIVDPSIGKWGMARLWRMWMASTAVFLNKQGMKINVMTEKGVIADSRELIPEDCHEIFTKKYLGTNNKGERMSWQKSEGENVADKGQRYYAMCEHQIWMLENGIEYIDPRESEFRQMCKSMNLD